MGTDEVGLIGNFEPGDAAGMYQVDLVYFNRSTDGFTLVKSEMVPVTTFNGKDRRPPAPNPAPPAADLTGITWQWVQTVYADFSHEDATDPSRYTVTFGTDGQLTAKLDCNSGGGPYTLDGANLTIGLLISTQMGCPADTQGSVFASDLGNVTTWDIENGQLSLNLGSGDGVMIFRPAP